MPSLFSHCPLVLVGSLDRWSPHPIANSAFLTVWSPCDGNPFCFSESADAIEEA